MTFTCDGTTFSALTLDTTTSYALYATLIADGTWYENTRAKMTAKINGHIVDKESFKICDYLYTGTCGQPGTVILDLTNFLPDGADTNTMNAMLSVSYIEVKTKPNGKYEKCTEPATITSSVTAAYQSTSTSTTQSASGRASKTAGFVLGAVALVGLAAYAVRRKKLIRIRTAPPKTSSNRQKLFGGDVV